VGNHIRIVEVGPRDGLQNERSPIETEAKSAFIARLVDAGLHEVEATSFVSPKWVPQLGDAAEVWGQLPPNGMFSALVPNLKGLERALTLGVQRIAVFTAASEAFTAKNINMGVDESLAVFEQVLSTFRAAVPDGWVRGYVSTAFDCPYTGPVPPEQTAGVANRLLRMGVNEVSIGDTIGVAVPTDVTRLSEHLLDLMNPSQITYHFHDTRGTAIANVAAAMAMGITSFDASAGGLGGCPYAPGAGGNLATDDLVYFLDRSGYSTGVDPRKLAEASLPVLKLLGRSPSKAQLALLGAECSIR
jgi:hydroxymethylglutaryl-CoA lyase